jgi:Ni2+-binding GTPase involved in maturation of urease and hydrogenase
MKQMTLLSFLSLSSKFKSKICHARNHHFNGKLTLNFKEKFNPELVTVKNINSQIIETYSISKNTSNEFEIELNAVNGIYFIEVFDGENTITKKVIKN